MSGKINKGNLLIYSVMSQDNKLVDERPKFPPSIVPEYI